MSNTTYEKNLDGLQPKETPNGVRLDLRVYVYPDGHGNIIVEGQKQNYPASSSEVASNVFSGIWKRASEFSAKTTGSNVDHGLQPELASWLETIGVRPRQSIGAIALQNLVKKQGLHPTEMSSGIIAARDE
jgi:hypothetical protein